MGEGGVEWERRHLCAILGGAGVAQAVRSKRVAGKWHLARARDFPRLCANPFPNGLTTRTTPCRAYKSRDISLASDNLMCYTLTMIAANSTVDDFDATLTCEEYYMEREWEDEDDELEDDELEDDEDELEDEEDEDDSDDDDDDYEDDDEFDDDDEWEDIEDDVADCFDCDGTVSENGFAQLFDMERRGYFA